MELILHSVMDGMLLWTSYTMGTAAGALAGCVLGVILSYGYASLDVIGMYTLVGICMGIFRKTGKLGQCIFSYSALVLLDYFFSGLQFSYHLDVSYLAAGIIFLLVPLEKKKGLRKKNQEEKAMIYQVANVAIRNRLREYAGSFGRLATILGGDNQDKLEYTSIDSKNLVEEIAGQMCSTCSRRGFCIDREYMSTFQSTHEIVCALEEGKGMTIEDIPMDFSNRCIKLGEFLMTADRRVELARVNVAWSNRLKEGRRVIAGQFQEAADVMDKFSNDIGKEQLETVEKERKIKNRMRLSGISIKKIIPMKEEGEEIRYYMVAKYNKGKVITTREVAKILTRVMKEPMCPTELCPRLLNQQYQVLSFCQANRFAVTHGVCHYAKAMEEISGDNYSVIQGENRVTMVLADGMGSGQSAYDESCSIVEMIEQFLEAGLPVEESIRLMNGALSLHVDKDIFTTLDVASVDLKSGMVDFIKFGAATTFLKRGSYVETIMANSLPMGMVQMSDSYLVRKKVFDGDIMIMMSDGVLEALPAEDKEDAMKELLKQMEETNSQKIAEYVMNKVAELSGDIGKDDCTVMALSVYIP